MPYVWSMLLRSTPSKRHWLWSKITNPIVDQIMWTFASTNFYCSYWFTMWSHGYGCGDQVKHFWDKFQQLTNKGLCHLGVDVIKEVLLWCERHQVSFGLMEETQSYIPYRGITYKINFENQ